jgi:alkylation response protein AidB-like acyl-CoA dehydrogenase
MNLLPTDEQTQIVDLARKFLGDEAPVSRFRDAKRQIGNDDAKLWPKLAEMGFLGIALPEQVGGIGLSTSDEALLCREFGYFLISPAVLAMLLGARSAFVAGNESLCREILSGSASVGLALARESIFLGPQCSGAFQLLDGTTDYLFAVSEDGAALIPRSAFGEFEAVICTDSLLAMERGSIRDAPAAVWLPASVEPIHMRNTLLLAAYAVGLSEAARDMAVGYAGLREQFGKPIGSFQAIKHKCADMAIRSEAALCQSWFASVVLEDGGADAPFQVTASKIVAVSAAMQNAAQNIQVHGAIGFTAEIDAHLYVKRAHIIDALGGNQRRQKSNLLRQPIPA